MHSLARQIELNAVVRTGLLQHRAARPPDYEAETRALVSLAQMLANPPRDILQRLVEAVLELCQGGSAGISIIEDHLGDKVFRWHALAGALAAHRWGTTPRDFSPCGIVIDRNAAQLMHLPERHFHYLTNVKPQVVEVLLVPFSVHGQPVGTIWVVSHDDHRKFDAEDERLVKELGRLATTAYQFASSVQRSKINDRRKDEFLATLACELRAPLFTAARATSELGQIQLRGIKRVIKDLLHRTRSSFESITAACALSTDEPLLFEGPGVPAAVRDSRTRLTRSGPVPLPARTACDAPAADATGLLRRMRSGDQRALQELYDCTVGSVYALALAILKSREDAEEVVCDTYARAWSQSERFDAERSSPLGWLMMMCRSHAIDRLRHNRARGSARTVALEQVCELANDAITQEELLSLFHNGSRVQRALATLSPQRLKLVGLAFFEGLSAPEMAERTGMPIGTVKSHIRRALVELRRTLEPCDQAAGAQ
jgi:RNA polymerase sigma factor (sigma-70 family)